MVYEDDIVNTSIKIDNDERKKMFFKKKVQVAPKEPTVYQWWFPGDPIPGPKPVPQRWVVVRYNDSKGWCGPWVHNGQRFTVYENQHCIFKSQEAAEECAMGENFNFRWDAYEL